MDELTILLAVLGLLGIVFIVYYVSRPEKTNEPKEVKSDPLQSDPTQTAKSTFRDLERPKFED